MVKEYKNGVTVLYILDNGTTTEPKAKVNLFILMEMYTKEHGSTIKPTDMESIITLMEQSMKVNGLMISNMEKEKKAGKMVHFSKVITLKEKSTVLDTTAGTTEVNILVTGTRIKSMDLEPTVG